MYEFVSCYSDKFPYEEAKSLYEERKHLLIPDKIIPFQEFLSHYNGFVFAVLVENNFEGVIYLHDFEKKEAKFVSCFLSGYAKPKNAIHTVNAIKLIAQKMFDDYHLEKIFTKPGNRAAKICDLRAGFKKYNDDLLVIEV